jgi:hypothetical protein
MGVVVVAALKPVAGEVKHVARKVEGALDGHLPRVLRVADGARRYELERVHARADVRDAAEQC